MAGRRAVHERSGKVLAEELEMPRTFIGRGVGLMFRKRLEPGRGMWIAPCNGIHMMFMNFAIDAVFLDAKERVRKVYRRLPARLDHGCVSAAAAKSGISRNRHAGGAVPSSNLLAKIAAAAPGSNRSLGCVPRRRTRVPSRSQCSASSIR